MRVITDELLQDLMRQAEAAPRGRVHYLLHEHHEVVQRMINAMQPRAYFPPHKHEDPDKVELMCPLIGRFAYLEFAPDGTVQQIAVIDAAVQGSQARLVDIPPRTYHAIVALSPAAVLEIIQGPFEAATHKRFAPFAPLEGSPDATAYLAHLRGLVEDYLR